MSDRRRSLGGFGERVAVAHLEAKGFRILDRNFRTREGEIDIVAEKDGCVAFVEVRARRGERMGSAADSITPRKRARLLALAQAYVQAHEGLSERQRIDVITVSLAPDGRVLSVEHIEDAVSDASTV
ncbi:MAG: YraN family protein [Dehalococcoidia bacterium]